MLDAIHAWVEAHEGHFPSYGEFLASKGLPNKDTVKRMLGPMPVVKARYVTVYGPRHGWVTCPRCGGLWWSPDRYDMQRHPYEAQTSGVCRKPGQYRFSRRPRRRNLTGTERLVKDQAERSLARSLLTEAVTMMRLQRRLVTVLRTHLHHQRGQAIWN
jgi:hypothetical protein